MKRQVASTDKVVEVAQSSNSQQKTPDILQVKVYSPYQTYFDEPAYSVSAVNDSGPFDILPRHHNFLCLLNGGNVRIQSPHGDKKIRISHGVMHVKNNKVTVFLDV